MKVLVFGVILIAVAVAAVVPAGLAWWPDVLAFIRGGLPILAGLLGLLMFFLGIGDIKERISAKKGEKTGEAG